MATTAKPKLRWKLRACPRCIGGDMYYDDHSSQCLQCGYTLWDDMPLALTVMEETNIKTEVNDNGKLD